MINLLLSLIATALVTVGFGWALGYPKISVAYGIVPGLIAGGVSYFYLARRVWRELQAASAEVQRILVPPKNWTPQMGPVKLPFDQAIAVMERTLRWKPWQFLVASQVEAQIGTLYYYDKKFEKALPHLERGFSRNWVAKAMQGCCYYRMKRYDDMKKVFELAVKLNEKEALLWNLYAWCLLTSGDRDGALAVLSRARTPVKNDERTEKNWKNVQNGKEMTMKGWNEMWYQFHFEQPVQYVTRQPLPRGNHGLLRIR